ncbi:hypothetical protein MMH89_01975 [Candidatus Comchoanobacter bicostacola]|uniref:tRNA threonylcarbamoyladenosine biosynthesis protein TsaB n=1 Tax=Candidatus Comchoanobacter bicostacola TaxID=2919598 RepID=A0ABY5DK97_9GAMM|nr:hypothetical protein [Candidatus Comchoanobacter bicostacola]UTC24916.1 hypothetical protein MMH89_01975 [Candidatus Comchoanobacter bicostacola]
MIIAIDTSQMTYSIAISQGNSRELITHEWEDVQTTLSDMLSDLDYTKIEAIIICSGPGRYSGIRSAAAFTQGVHAATNCSVYSLSAFEIIQDKVPENDDYRIVLEARKGQVYQQAVTQNKAHPAITIDLPNIKTPAFGNLEHPSVDYITYNAQDLLKHFNHHKDKLTPEISLHYLRKPTE